MDVKNQLLEYRKQAVEKRKFENRYLKDREAVLLLAHALPETNSLFLGDALKLDLQTRPLYDALAAWCDPENGLAKQFPLQILKVAERLLALEK